MTSSTEEKTMDERESKVKEDEARLEGRCRLGENLSQARQTKDISIDEASEQLRIRRHYLEALESGNWKALPEEVYVMGFLRQYANLLGVDISQDIEALKTGEYKLTKPFTMPDPPIAMNRAWAIAAGACFLILLILFNVVDEGKEEHRPMQLKMGTPAFAPKAPIMMGQPAVETTGAELPAQAEGIQAPPDASVAEEKAMKAVSDTEPSLVEPTESQPLTDTSTPETIEPAALDSSPREITPLPTQSTGRHAFDLIAVDEDVWLQLYNPDGSLAKEALLRGGQSMRFNTDEDYLLLTSGNPLALSITIDGLSVAEPGDLGEKDKVLHDHRLQTPVSSPDTNN